MKVYAVCELCDDYYYGYLAPRKIFEDKKKAQVYAKELIEDDYNVAVKEYEVE
jgi:hypothetical protein